MSRHYFDTTHKGFPITVLLGWDRRLNYFFLCIEKASEMIDDTMHVKDEDFLYDNLREIDPFIQDLDYYRQVLSHFQILVPESMFIEVQRDFEQNAGNRMVKHQADGLFAELGR